MTIRRHKFLNFYNERKITKKDPKSKPIGQCRFKVWSWDLSCWVSCVLGWLVPVGLVLGINFDCWPVVTTSQMIDEWWTMNDDRWSLTVRLPNVDSRQHVLRFFPLFEACRLATLGWSIKEETSPIYCSFYRIRLGFTAAAMDFRKKRIQLLLFVAGIIVLTITGTYESLSISISLFQIFLIISYTYIVTFPFLRALPLLSSPNC